MLDAQTTFENSLASGPPAVVDSDAEPNWEAMILLVRDQRSEDAFSALFNHFAPRIKGFLINGGASPQMAEECAQDVMVTLWHKARLFDPTRASAATWLFTIARNKRIDALRKAARPEPEELPWGPKPELPQAEVLGLKEETVRLGQAIDKLPQKQRAIIESAFFGEKTHVQLAAETGLPLGTIKSRIRLALERLRGSMS